jgi:hypothetical protein
MKLLWSMPRRLRGLLRLRLRSLGLPELRECLVEKREVFLTIDQSGPSRVIHFASAQRFNPRKRLREADRLVYPNRNPDRTQALYELDQARLHRGEDAATRALGDGRHRSACLRNPSFVFEEPLDHGNVLLVFQHHPQGLTHGVGAELGDA